MKVSIANVIALSEIGASYARAHGLKGLLDLEILEFVYKYPECTRSKLIDGVSYTAPWARVRSLSSFFNVEHVLIRNGGRHTAQYVATLTEAGKRVVEGFADYVKRTLLDGHFDFAEELE